MHPSRLLTVLLLCAVAGCTYVPKCTVAARDELVRRDAELRDNGHDSAHRNARIDHLEHQVSRFNSHCAKAS